MRLGTVWGCAVFVIMTTALTEWVRTETLDERVQPLRERSHGLHGAWQRAGRGSYGEKNGPAKSCEGRSDPQTSRLEEETPTATSFPQGANAILEQGTALSALPLVLISMLFLCRGGPCIRGPTLAQPEE
ncbi:hypothetical protein fugu_013419 [Takifugu bimaculatus]|uniref:Apelin APJ endogenous ligand n=2 Tax=Takifugu TaxID=31032 RepID=A0A5C6MKR6_9TELE|nr:hypothetical protein fugu_013419 [Takifugu bimaculatus]TWW55225.1 Apelin APJ endogenous ligand [Takifugu flavidus]